ncbi:MULTISPECIES: hypothetical protein [Paenibacillus]|nr:MULTISPECIES: hypothetical protein [Paenibacillus]MDU4694412.1 hypothetical protein [Paenibacillus sp.]
MTDQAIEQPKTSNPVTDQAIEQPRTSIRAIEQPTSNYATSRAIK